MNTEKTKRDRILTGVVILVSVAGICYFGYQAFTKDAQKYPENPFAYDIESYKKSGEEFDRYGEWGRIDVDAEYLDGLAVGPDDSVYVSADSSIRVFRGKDREQSVYPLGGRVHCLAVGQNHDIYLGFIDHVEILDKEGRKKATWDSLGERAIITSLALSGDYVFIADAGNRIVWKFDAGGRLSMRIGDKNEAKDIPGFIIPSPYFDVALDPDGFLWAANTGRHSLENYTVDGDFRSSWGEFSMEIEGFCGCCNPSHFVIMEDGSFVTSEKGIARVKVHNRLGELTAVVAGPEQFVEGTVGLDLALDSSQRIYVLDPPHKAVRIFSGRSSEDN